MGASKASPVLYFVLFCVGASKAPPVLYFVIQHRKAVPLFLVLCTYAYNKLLMAWERVLCVDYSTRDRVSRTIQHSASPRPVYSAYSTPSHAITITYSITEVVATCDPGMWSGSPGCEHYPADSHDCRVGQRH